jgi:hypothetical protein
VAVARVENGERDTAGKSVDERKFHCRQLVTAAPVGLDSGNERVKHLNRIGSSIGAIPTEQLRLARPVVAVRPFRSEAYRHRHVDRPDFGWDVDAIQHHPLAGHVADEGLL